MKTSQVYDPVSGNALDIELVALRQYNFDLSNNKQLRTYTAVSQLGLSDTATLDDIVKALPKHSEISFDHYADVYPNLDLPPYHGNVTIRRSSNISKAYITFGFESFFLSQGYNDYYTPALRGWHGSGYVVASASSVNNLCKSIPFAGVAYYFNGSNTSSLTDKPVGATSGGIVSKKPFGINSYIITYTENFATLQTWICRDENGTYTDWVKVTN